MIHAAPKTKSKAKAKKLSPPKAVVRRSMPIVVAAAAASAAGTSVHNIDGFTWDIDPSLSFPGMIEQYQIPQAAPSALPEVAPLAAVPHATVPSSGTGAAATSNSRSAPVVSSNLLTEVLQSGGKFDPTQFDFSVLTLPNTHKASRKRKAGEGGDKVAGNKNSSIL